MRSQERGIQSLRNLQFVRGFVEVPQDFRAVAKSYCAAASSGLPPTTAWNSRTAAGQSWESVASRANAW